MQKLKSAEYALNISNLYAGGLLIISLVFLQDFLSAGELDLPEFISVAAFSVALPLLGGILVVNAVEREYPFGPPHSRIAKIVQLLFTLGVLIALIGVDAAFWHGSWMMGAGFVGASLLAILIYGRYVMDLEKR